MGPVTYTQSAYRDTPKANNGQPVRSITARLAYWAFAGALALCSGAAQADNFLDHRVTKDTGGIYSLQDAVPISLAVFATGCALWQGTEDRFGKTCWEAGEAGIAGILSAEVLQFATGRRSPAETPDPGQWFSGGKGSFPSTHVTLTTAVVTPFIYQYFHEQPAVAALAILPLYENGGPGEGAGALANRRLGGRRAGFCFRRVRSAPGQSDHFLRASRRGLRRLPPLLLNLLGALAFETRIHILCIAKLVDDAPIGPRSPAVTQLVILVGIFDVLYDAWPGSSPHRDGLHALFGILLWICVVGRFYRRMHQAPLLEIADIRPFSRHLAALVYLLLYVLVFCRMIVDVWYAAPPGAMLRAGKDLQSYVAYGVLALITIRTLASYIQRNGRLR
jgi:hypothetical protein